MSKSLLPLHICLHWAPGDSLSAVNNMTLFLCSLLTIFHLSSSCEFLPYSRGNCVCSVLSRLHLQDLSFPFLSPLSSSHFVCTTEWCSPEARLLVTHPMTPAPGSGWGTRVRTRKLSAKCLELLTGSVLKGTHSFKNKGQGRSFVLQCLYHG